MTLLAWLGSERAFRQAVAAEAGDLAAEMSTRVDVVAGELKARLTRMSGRPHSGKESPYQKARREALAAAEGAELRLLLRAILSGAERRQGAFPFARAPGGRAYAPDAADETVLGDMEALSRLFAAVQERYGRLVVLVNNAATNPYYGHVLDTDLGAFQKTVDVNIRGYFFASVLGGRLMRASGGGSIINIASVNAVRPGPLQGIYSVTKGAVLNMTKVFARECGPDGIRCNAILPGLIRTRFAGALLADEQQREHYVGSNPLRRIGEPQDIAGAAVYLASEASSYVTGEFLVVDGGFLV